MKVIIPNPNFPIIDTPRGDAKLFEHFANLKNHTVAVVPNTTEVQVSCKTFTPLYVAKLKKCVKNFRNF